MLMAWKSWIELSFLTKSGSTDRIPAITPQIKGNINSQIVSVQRLALVIKILTISAFN